jgi:hypothetical protein
MELLPQLAEHDAVGDAPPECANALHDVIDPRKESRA